MAGLLTGCIRMILDFVYIAPSCGEEDTRPAIVKNVIIVFNFVGHFLMMHFLVQPVRFSNIHLENDKMELCKFETNYVSIFSVFIFILNF
jgi:hypothetical protein